MKSCFTAKVCSNCGKNISLPNFNRHYNACINKRIKTGKFCIDEKFDEIDGKYKCKTCSILYGSKQAASGHYWAKHTEEGRNYKKLHHTVKRKKGIPAWNRGLTKETDERVKRNGISISKVMTGRPGRKHTEETKKKISDIRKRYIEKHPDQVPYLLNHSSKISYPEKYFKECFLKVQNVKFQHSVFRYKVDFANISEKLYFEIDGEQHYLDKRIVEHDKERTKNLSNLGWNGIRVRWSKFQRLSEEEKMKKVKEIIEFMKWEEK